MVVNRSDTAITPSRLEISLILKTVVECWRYSHNENCGECLNYLFPWGRSGCWNSLWQWQTPWKLGNPKRKVNLGWIMNGPVFLRPQLVLWNNVTMTTTVEDKTHTHEILFTYNGGSPLYGQKSISRLNIKLKWLGKGWKRFAPIIPNLFIHGGWLQNFTVPVQVPHHLRSMECSPALSRNHESFFLCLCVCVRWTWCSTSD